MNERMAWSKILTRTTFPYLELSDSVAPGGVGQRTSPIHHPQQEAIVGHKPMNNKSEPTSMNTRTGLLASCALVFLMSACGTVPPKEDGPPAKNAAAGKSSSRKTAKSKSTASASAPAPAAPAPAPVTESKPVEKKSDAAEPDLPTRFAGHVTCPIPPEVPPGEELIIRCALKPGLGAHSVIVRYRVSGKEDYSTIDAIRSPKGWYVAKIKGNEVRGSSLQLYVEAYSPGNRVAGTSGTDDNPNVILIQGGVSGPSTDEDPLKKIQREQEAEHMQTIEGRRRPSPSLWLGFGIGTGEGWFPSRTAENEPAQAKGWASGGLFHLLPEIGYNLNPNLAFSLQGRWQFVKTETSGGGSADKPNSRALAVLGCVYLMTDSRTSDWQLFGTAAIGAGSAFRLYVAPHPSSGNDNFPNSGTVNGGPLVAGAGGGIIFHLTNFVALTGHVRSLAGFPKTAVIIEGGIGAQLALWPLSAYQSSKPSQTPQDLEPEPDYAPSEPVD
jgi:hypothetical protein